MVVHSLPFPSPPSIPLSLHFLSSLSFLIPLSFPLSLGLCLVLSAFFFTRPSCFLLSLPLSFSNSHSLCLSLYLSLSISIHSLFLSISRSYIFCLSRSFSFSQFSSEGVCGIKKYLDAITLHADCICYRSASLPPSPCGWRLVFLCLDYCV